LKNLEIAKKFESCFGKVEVMKSPQDRGQKQGKQGKGKSHGKSHGKSQGKSQGKRNFRR
jgi:hypothetical protein